MPGSASETEPGSGREFETKERPRSNKRCDDAFFWLDTTLSPQRGLLAEPGCRCGSARALRSTLLPCERLAAYPGLSELTGVAFSLHPLRDRSAMAPTLRPHTERPLYKLSVQLIDTYKLINKVYYERKTRRKAEQHEEEASNDWDDENYDYVVNVEDTFAEHYVIKDRIGKGSFGQVVRAYDKRTQTDVAIKIIKSKKPFALQAQTEIELLTALRKADHEDKQNIVRLLDHFTFRGHVCLVFEMLSYNLYELLKNTQFHGVSLNLVRKLAKQILHALAFLARPDVAVIHCDLKPENILLRHPRRSGIKIIDFGSSCRVDRRMYSYIQSRFYRSPEVMLGLPYTSAIDVWSLGCILVEMHTGEPLFSGADQLDQMHKLVDVLGMPPDSMINEAEGSIRDHFFELGRGHRWKLKRRTRPAADAANAQHRPSALPEAEADAWHARRSIASIVGASIGGPGGRRKGEPGHGEQHYTLFLDLVNRMLEYSPTTRIKPDEALKNSFLNDSIWASTEILAKTPPPPWMHPQAGSQHRPHPPYHHNQTSGVKHPLDFGGHEPPSDPCRRRSPDYPFPGQNGCVHSFVLNNDQPGLLARRDDRISSPTRAAQRRALDAPTAHPMDICELTPSDAESAERNQPGQQPRICDAGTQTSVS